MQAALGFLAAHLLLLAAGASLLYALRLVEPARGFVLPALGAAYFCGLALMMPLMIALLVADVRVTFVTLAVAAPLVTAGLVVAGLGSRRRELLPDLAALRARGTGVLERWAGRALLLALGGWSVAMAVWLRNLVTAWDDAHIWSFKALGIYYYGHLQPDLFTSTRFTGSHLDYPLLQPLHEALIYRAMGAPHLQLIHVELWIVLVSFLWTAVFLVSPRRAPATWLPAVALLAVAPAVYNWIVPGFADVTASCLVGAGALALALWLERRQPAHLLLAAVMLGAAANTKNEGLVAAAIALVASGAVALVVWERRALRLWLVSAGIAVLLLLPWRIFVHVHALQSTDVTPLSSALDWHFLSGRLSRLQTAADAVLFRFQNQDAWVWFVPIFLMLFTVALATATARRVAVFYFVTAAAMTAALLWVYWTSPVDLAFHLATSVDRTVTGILFVTAMGVVHLTALLAAPLARERGAA